MHSFSCPCPCHPSSLFWASNRTALFKSKLQDVTSQALALAFLPGLHCFLQMHSKLTPSPASVWYSSSNVTALATLQKTVIPEHSHTAWLTSLCKFSMRTSLSNMLHVLLTCRFYFGGWECRLHKASRVCVYVCFVCLILFIYSEPTWKCVSSVVGIQ